MRIDLTIAGIISGAIGVDICIGKGGFLYRQPVPQYAGIVLIVFGIFSFCAGLFTSRKKRDKYICYKCEKTIHKYGDEKEVCGHCGIPLEPLKGFYDRHPEKK